MTNKEIYLEYETYLTSTGYAMSTAKTYLNHARHYYSWAQWMNVDILTANTLDLIKYKEQIKKIYSISTINNKLSAVRNLYNYLIQTNKRYDNPVFNALFISQDKSRPQYLTLEQRSLLMEYLGTKGEHIQMAYNIMMYGGLRVSEVVDLDVSQVEEREGKIFLHVIDRKTKKLRLCPIFDDFTAQQIIRQMSALMTGEKLVYVSIRTLQHYAKEFQDNNHIKFSVHTCRHIYATDRIRSGVKIELLKTLMGHKSINTTLLYIYISENEIYSLLD